VSSDEEDVIVPMLLSLLSIIEKMKNQKECGYNQKRTKKNLIKSFLCELRNDELKYKNYILVFIINGYMYTCIHEDTRNMFLITSWYRYNKIYKAAVKLVWLYISY